MVSFDVKSLFTSIPVDLILKITKERLIKDALIKDALPVILPVLTELINRSLLTSVFPTSWRESEVVPLHHF